MKVGCQILVVAAAIVGCAEPPNSTLVAPPTVARSVAVATSCPPSTAYVRQLASKLWEVRPTNFASTHALYGQCDGDNIQYAIDIAAPGSTIRISAGRYILSKIADAGDDFDVTTAKGSFRYISQHKVWWYAGLPDVIRQSINIHKPGLTITGVAAQAGENPRASIEYPDFHVGGVFGWSGSTASFVINAPRITLQQLRFSGFEQPVNAFHPGFDIRDNLVTNAAIGDFLTPDVELTYPAWPSTERAIVSRYRNNRLLFVANPPHVVGSEIVVSNNHIEYFPCSELPCYRSGLIVIAWSWGNEIGGGPESFTPVPFNHHINWDHVLNVRIEDNYVNCNGAAPGIFVWNPSWGHTGIVKNVLITGNVVENCLAAMFVGDDQSTPGDDIIHLQVLGNTFRNIQQSAVDAWSIGNPDGVRDLVVSGNRFENVGSHGGFPPGGLWVETGVHNGRFENNDYTKSGCPPWGATAVGCILLDAGSSGNFVRETRFPTGTTACDQVLDLGVNNTVDRRRCRAN